MNKFRAYIYDVFEETILKWDMPKDVYTVGFLILDDDDDLRKPTLRLVYKSHSQVKLKSPKSMRAGKENIKQAHSELEATWNFSFWLWKIYAAICTHYILFDGDIIDHQGILLRREWIKFLGLWYEDEFEEKNFENVLELGGQIGTNFDELCIGIAKDLHKIIQKRVGKDLPIIFFKREGSDPETTKFILEANDAYLLDGFTNYLVAYCGWQSST